jgi:hypothetical protein
MGEKASLHGNRVQMNQAVGHQLKTSTQVSSLLETASFGIESFTLFQELDGIFGQMIDVQNEDNSFSIREMDEHHVNSTVHEMRFNPIEKDFVVKRVGEKVPFLVKDHFSLDGEEFTMVKTSFNSQSQTVLKMGDKTVVSIGSNVDHVHVLPLESDRLVIISALIGVEGLIKIYALTKNGPKYGFKQIGSLHVGPAATQMVAFKVEEDIYLAVARSFSGLCSVTDSGSLVFLWEERKVWHLIQRVAVRDSHRVAYYSLNEQHYLLFSDTRDSEDTLEPQALHVYRSRSMGRGCLFIPFQKLLFDNVRDLTVLAFGPRHRPELLVAALNETTLQVWRQDGYSGFTETWPMRANGGQSLRPILVGQDLYLIVAQNRRCIGSMIVKANTRGSTLFPHQLVSSCR